MLFTLKEFIISRSKTLSLEIADKLYWYHIIPMIPVRDSLGVSITASQHSGYRPKWYELQRKRSGNSQHVFKGKGAVDWTCENFIENKDRFLELIIQHTDYTRIAIYKGFIHCDHKPTTNGRREIYISDKKSNWEFLRFAS